MMRIKAIGAYRADPDWRKKTGGKPVASVIAYRSNSRFMIGAVSSCTEYAIDFAYKSEKRPHRRTTARNFQTGTQAVERRQ